MKLTLLIWFFLSITSQIHAQSTFEFLLGAQQRITSGMAIDDGAGGIIALVNVRTGTDYSPSNPISFFILQVCRVISFQQ